MSAENDAYAEGARLLKALSALKNEVSGIDASDTQCKTRALELIDQSREKLREALSVLSSLV